MNTKIVSVMPYSDIQLVKIFTTTEDECCIEFCLKDHIAHTYIVKPEHIAKKAYGNHSICDQLETDWSYDDNGADSDREKEEIDELLSWSEFFCVSTWGFHTGTLSLSLDEMFKPIVEIT